MAMADRVDAPAPVVPVAALRLVVRLRKSVTIAVTFPTTPARESIPPLTISKNPEDMA